MPFVLLYAVAVYVNHRPCAYHQVGVYRCHITVKVIAKQVKYVKQQRHNKYLFYAFAGGYKVLNRTNQQLHYD